MHGGGGAWDAFVTDACGSSFPCVGGAARVCGLEGYIHGSTSECEVCLMWAVCRRAFKMPTHLPPAHAPSAKGQGGGQARAAVQQDLAISLELTCLFPSWISPARPCMSGPRLISPGYSYIDPADHQAGGGAQEPAWSSTLPEMLLALTLFQGHYL